MDPLATVDDVDPDGELTEAEKGRAGRLLAQASARFRREARQEFTAGESTTRLRVTGGAVYLPQWPALEVLSVVDDAGRPVQFSRVPAGGQVLHIERPGEFTIRPGVVVEPPGGSPRLEFVVVRYTHGGQVPEDVCAAVAAAVSRVMAIDPDAARGASQVTDTRGPFSRTRQFAAWTVGGQVLLSPDDVALARSYRPKPPRLWVMRP